MKRFFTTIYLVSCSLWIFSEVIIENKIRYDLNHTDYTATVVGAYNIENVVIQSSVYNSGKMYSVTSIGEQAFSQSLHKKVVIPNTVTKIGRRAFAECYELTSVTLPNSNLEIGASAFTSCLKLSDISLPNTLKTIGDQAFSVCEKIDTVFISSTVDSIGESAFRGCASLNCIIVDPANSKYDSRDSCNAIIRTTDNRLIAGCNKTIIPSTVTSIHEYAFWRCEHLLSIVIPDAVTQIEPYTFQGCKSLANVTFSNNLTSIKSCAFTQCPISSLFFPATLTEIASSAFYDCNPYLQSITVDSDNPIYDCRGDCNALIETSSNTLLLGCNNTVIPNTISILASNAFLGCQTFTSVEIPNSVTKIDHYAFYNCSNLSEVVLPENLSEIGNMAFIQTSLSKIECRAVTPPALSVYGPPFDSRIQRTASLYVPSPSVDLYKNDSEWGKFINILPIEDISTSCIYPELDLVARKFIQDGNIVIQVGDKRFDMLGR